MNNIGVWNMHNTIAIIEIYGEERIGAGPQAITNLLTDVALTEDRCGFVAE
jgi:hypothetical protein